MKSLINEMNSVRTSRK